MSLAILPEYRAFRAPSGKICLTKKLIEGMKLYVEFWQAPVHLYLEEATHRSSNLDEIEVDPAELPFGCEIVSFMDEKLGERLAGHDLVMGSTSHRQNHLSGVFRALGIPFVYVTEYSLKTRLQMISADTKNLLVRWRRFLWAMKQEKRQQAAIRIASGVQCNGTPTYEPYRRINDHCLLYFDTRSADSLLATESEVRERTAHLLAGRPLRLLFSGRFIPMKGADHLVPVADELRALNVPFHMTICGDGVLKDSMAAEISRRGLSSHVTLAGVLDYNTELVPFTKYNTDLFVCCHQTGDPSCTYVETMACGVPMVGYANEAFRGLVETCGTNWAIPVSRPKPLAAEIARLNTNRHALVEASFKALDFARQHTFERTYQARIAHLRGVLNQAALAVV
jgi:glycosyltransferase involved in cell wall biosynthesis